MGRTEERMRLQQYADAYMALNMPAEYQATDKDAMLAAKGAKLYEKLLNLHCPRCPFTSAAAMETFGSIYAHTKSHGRLDEFVKTVDCLVEHGERGEKLEDISHLIRGMSALAEACKPKGTAGCSYRVRKLVTIEESSTIGNRYSTPAYSG